MKCVDWASNIWRNELSESELISVPSLSAYYRANVGDLNNLIGSSYTLNNEPGTANYLELVNNGNINSLIDDGAAQIYKYVYLLSYYSRLVRNFTGVGNYQILTEATSDGGTLRFDARLGYAKLYVQLRKDVEETLNRLVNKYKFRNQTAVDVQGDDKFVIVGDSNRYEGVLYQRNIA